MNNYEDHDCMQGVDLEGMGTGERAHMTYG